MRAKYVTGIFTILLCVSLSACANKIENVEESGVNSNIEAYINVIRNYISDGKKDIAVSFIQLDDDDTKEMVIFVGDAEADGAYLYTVDDNEAILIQTEFEEKFGQYGGFSYLGGKGIFVSEQETITDTGIAYSRYYYQVENQQAVCVAETKCETLFDVEDSTYYVNGAEADYSEYENIEEEYKLQDMSTVSYTESIPVLDDNFDEICQAWENGVTSSKQELSNDSEAFDYEALGVQKYSYPSEFTLGQNLEGMLVQLGLCYDDFGVEVVNDSLWEEQFISHFLLNSRYSFDYLNEITAANDGLIHKAQAEYMQYSLTGIKNDLSIEEEETLDTANASSGYSFGQITDYEFETDADEVKITADFEVGFDGSEEYTKQYTLSAVLIRNPYSCFDGYSVKSFTKEDVTSNVINDGSEHTFTGYDIGYEENGVFALEFDDSEDNLNYDYFVYIDLSGNAELADLIRQNSGSEFKVTYILENMDSDVISNVVPVAVTLEAD